MTSSISFKPLWWAYFSVMLVLHLLSLLALRGGTPTGFLWFCLGSLSLIGLAAYLLQRPLLRPGVWLAVLAASALGVLFGIVFGLLFESSETETSVFDLVLGLALISLAAPGWWALWAYAMKSPAVWMQAPAQAAKPDGAAP